MEAQEWRLAAITPWAGGGLSLNTVHLYEGATRHDDVATLTCSHVPASGDLSDLQEAAPTAAVEFGAATVRAGGFFLRWSFATAVKIDRLKVAASTGISECTLFALVGGVWTFAGRTGAQSLSATETTELELAARDPLAGASACMAGDKVEDAVSGTSWVLGAGTAVQSALTRGGLPTLKLVKGETVYYPTKVAAFANWKGGDITVETHVYVISPALGGVGTRAMMVYNGDGPSSTVWWSFGPRADGSLELYFWSGATTSIVSSSGIVPSDQWVHIAFTCSSGTVYFFVNGTLVYSGAIGATPVGGSNAHNLCIGNDNSSFSGSGDFFVSDLIFTPSAKYTTSFRVVGLAPRRLVTLSAGVGGSVRDTEFGGAGRIWGTAKTETTPGIYVPTKARVVLLAQRGKTLVRETWSDPATGAFEFQDIDTTQKFLTLAEDADGAQTPVAANYLAPE